MSNRLYNLAQRVASVTPNYGAARPIRATEMAVLLALANDARDGAGGRTTPALTTAEIMRRTRLSESPVRKAFAVLQASGHITREAGPEGMAATTRVHPRGAVQPLFEERATPVPETGDPCFRNRGLFREESTMTTHHASARANLDGEAGTEVAAVFDAWDAMNDRIGLPGPVQRDADRARAVTTKLGEVKLWRVLLLIDAVGRSDFLTGRKKRGQADWRASFDEVFEVGRFKGMGLFRRILEGSFNSAPVPVEPPPISNFATTIATEKIDTGDPPDVARVRALLAAKLGPATCAAWLDPLRFVVNDGAIAAVAPSAFVADHVVANYRGAIGRAVADVFGDGVAVRIVAAAGASP